MKLTKRMNDLTGLKFGSLTAIRPAYKDKRNLVYWHYSCVCGNTHIARANTIKYEVMRYPHNSDIPSCGCKNLEIVTKHGHRGKGETHPAYACYNAMMDRCYNPKSSNYKWYGARGVLVCPQWKNKPSVFMEWALENGWEKGKHIDKDILCDHLKIHPHIYSTKTCQFVSAKTNIGYATNRANFGKHPNVRISQDDVSEIERLYFNGVETNKSQLARDFNLKSPSSIGRLIKIAKIQGRG